MHRCVRRQHVSHVTRHLVSVLTWLQHVPGHWVIQWERGRTVLNLTCGGGAGLAPLEIVAPNDALEFRTLGTPRMMSTWAFTPAEVAKRVSFLPCGVGRRAVWCALL